MTPTYRPEEFLSFAAITVADKTKPDQRRKTQEKLGETVYSVHAYGRNEGIAGIIVSDEEYPLMVAQQLLSKLCDDFLSAFPKLKWGQLHLDQKRFPILREYISKYQDPQQADSIMKVQKELDETKIILSKTIEAILERGEKLDTLVAKSDALSSSSKLFYKQAKNQNSCCTIM
ncbi:palmitoyltransferase [Varicellaria rhodocarpa]|nr:palmitoyltransferase [Varicellaria rhodocarpa]